MSWPLYYLKDLCTFQKKSKSKAGDGLKNGEFPFYTSSQILSKWTNDPDYNLSPSLIFGTGGLPSVHITSSKFSMSGDCIAITPNDSDKVCTKYIFFYLIGNMHILEEGFKGAGLKHISKAYIENIQIPIPSVEIQKQIVAVLEKADQLRKDCQKMEQELNNLAQSVFIDMFGDPVTNPKGWNLCSLSEVVTDIQGGKSPKCDSCPAKANHWGVLKLSSVTGGFYKPSNNKAILDSTLINSDIEVKKNDLLFTRKNTYELVGACAYVRQTPEKLMLPDLIFRFHMKKQLKIYFWGLFNSESFKLKIRALASGAAGSMPNIAKSKLNSLQLPLPPDTEVLKYNNLILSLWEQQDIVKNLQKSYEEQFNSLIQKAFKGELKLKNLPTAETEKECS